MSRAHLSLLCSLLLLPSGSIAQSENNASAKENLADCVVATMPREAHDAVFSTLIDRRFNKKFGDLMRKKCDIQSESANASANTVHSANALRSALASSLVRANYSQSGPLDFSKVPALWHIQSTKPSGVGGGHRNERDFALKESASRRFLSIYGECIVREKPEPVRQFLLTSEGSKDEAKLFANLQPSLSSCLNKNVSLQLDQSLVRESLAYNYYRLAAVETPDGQGTN